jgi:hypothetical protein
VSAGFLSYLHCCWSSPLVSAFYCLLPPQRTCLDPDCTQRPRGSTLARRKELTEPKNVAVSVFSQFHGPIPGISTSLYCRQCHTRYYHTYYVHQKATTRTYYSDSTQYIHSAEHIFIVCVQPHILQHLRKILQPQLRPCSDNNVQTEWFFVCL